MTDPREGSHSVSFTDYDLIVLQAMLEREEQAIREGLDNPGTDQTLALELGLDLQSVLGMMARVAKAMP